MEPEQGVGGFSCRQSRRSATDTATANATVPLLVLPELVAALPAAERTAVGMHYLQGRMQHEIAAVLGCSQMTVSRLLRRALERLRAELVDSDPVPGSP